MTPEDFVRQHYPDAWAKHCPPAFQQGDARPIRREVWEILPGKELGHQPIAFDVIEERAWKNAEIAVRSEQEGKKTSAIEWIKLRCDILGANLAIGNRDAGLKGMEIAELEKLLRDLQGDFNPVQADSVIVVAITDSEATRRANRFPPDDGKVYQDF